MKPLIRYRRWTAGLALAAFVLAASSPAAQADHHGRRYKDGPGYYPGPVVRHFHCGYAPRRVVIVRHSDAAPLFAGLIGGFVLGNAVAHASAPVYAPEPSYYYWDPYCHERFASLELYRPRFHYHHPYVVRVISVESGACVGAYRWCDGGWRPCPYYGDDGRDGDRGEDWDGDYGGD